MNELFEKVRAEAKFNWSHAKLFDHGLSKENYHSRAMAFIDVLEMIDKDKAKEFIKNEIEEN